jgi:hypothetical protein
MTARVLPREGLVRSGQASFWLGRGAAAAPVLGGPAVPAHPRATSLAEVIRACARADEDRARARLNQVLGVMR